MSRSSEAELLRTPIRQNRRLWVDEKTAPYLFVAPMLLHTIGFIVLPAVMIVLLMFFDVDILGGTIDWVGLKNITRAINRGEIANSLWVTALYAIMTVIPSVLFGLLVALGINAVRVGAGFWRTVYFMPVAATLVAMSIVWRWMFLARRGVVDQTVGAWTGLTDWLSSTELSLPAVAIVGNWQQIAFVAIIYLAALSGVPKHLIEAARLDGANGFNRFWHVTWPALGPATVFTVVISSIQALRVFDTIATMTEGGPSHSSETLTYLLWKRGIYFFDIGGGAVVTFVLLVLALVATFIQRQATARLEKAGSR